MNVIESYDYKSHPANIGMDFEFCEKISEKVLKNYLSRAVTMAFETGEAINDNSTEYIRFILNVGAKFIGRLTAPWVVSMAELAEHDGQKRFIEKLHTYDPDIICEACIFENTTDKINEISIPNWVFEAFNMKIEKRNFNQELMLFPDGRLKNIFGEGSPPDITQTETQLFFYWRACTLINLGYEALHMGQVNMIAETDENFTCFTKVFDMIREYAKTHSRRKMVLINGHTHGMYNSRGELLYDFHEWPSRCIEPEGSVQHTPEEDKQDMIFGINSYPVNDWRAGIYGKSMGGKTPSGWECESLPYLVELDNAGGFNPETRDKPTFSWYTSWGYDEISWFANQKAEFRREWLKYAYSWVRDNDEPGHFELPARRLARVIFNGRDTWMYYAGRDDYGDEYIIREIFIENN
ncbi:MAG: hypothetical protein IKD04_03865 [Clostridia bacterium]|nr:hypothetical protein [Clostridia bacterium]